jgi:hypothetical protein
MRSTSFAASLPLNSPTTRRRSAVVAMAHGLEFRICRRLSSLEASVWFARTLLAGNFTI